MSIIELLPELWLLGVICALFVASLSDRKQSVMTWLPLAAGLGVVAAAAALGARGEFLYATYKVDALSQFFKLLIAGEHKAVDALPDLQALRQLETLTETWRIRAAKLAAQHQSNT